MNAVKLSQAIEDRGIRRSFIADKGGMSRSVVSNICNGKQVMSLEQAKHFAKILNFSSEEIFDIFFDGELPTAQFKSVKRKRI